MNTTPDSVIHGWLERIPGQVIQTRRLNGGVNNKAYVLECRDKKYVVKTFAPRKNGQTDKMEAEVSFLRYSNKVAARFTPQLYDVDNESHSILMEFIEGSRYASGQDVKNSDITCAKEFISSLNENLHDASGVVTMRARDGFSTLTEHLMSIRQRIDSMETGHMHIHHMQAGKKLLLSTRHLYDLLKESVYTDISHGKVSDQLDDSMLRISPSDFGFHNAIRTRTSVKFFDFEFSGWDDPAKLIVDFTLQPSIDVSRYGLCLLDTVGDRNILRIMNRANALIPILRLKWVTIVLGVLNPARFREMVNLNGSDSLSDEVEERLLRAGKMIEDQYETWRGKT